MKFFIAFLIDLVFGVLGTIFGAVSALLATFYGCQLLGEEIVGQAGWVFCFITIPIGAVIGLFIGAKLAKIVVEHIAIGGE